MGEGLLNLLGLSTPSPPVTASDAQADGAAAFRDAIASVNASLHTAKTAAPPQVYSALETDRTRLFEAYHKASVQLGKGEASGKDMMQRVVAAAGTLGSKAASTATAWAEAKQQWSAREAAFDDAVRQIGELEAAGHPKTATLRQLADSIRQRIGQQHFSDCVAAFDALVPKLAEILEQNNGAPVSTDPGAPAGSNLATLEVRVSYQGTPVPGATVRLTGPTQRPDAKTDASGVAIFSDIEPGKYYVNAAKQAFVFQPAHVPQGALLPGATYTASVTKAAQGQPPAPGYLYTGGGAAKPKSPSTSDGTQPDSGTHQGQTDDPAKPTIADGPPPSGFATVEVHIKDENGVPVGQAMIRISSGPTAPPDATTSAAGIARFQLVPGQYHVNAAKGNVVWQPAYIAAGKLQPGATYPVTLNKPHYSKPDGDTGSLSVHVAWSDSNEPVTIALVDIDGNHNYTMSVDSNGFAHFANLPVGPHSIKVTHFSSEYGPLSRSATATVTKDKNVTQTIRLARHENFCSLGVIIKWKDSAATGDGVAGATVIIDPPHAPQATTNADGYTSFNRLPAGTYTVTAFIPSTGQMITARNVILVIEEGKQVHWTTVSMQASRSAAPTNPDASNCGTLTVDVMREGSGLGAVGAIVSLSPQTVPPQIINNSGRTHFDKVPAGDYTVTAELLQEDCTMSRASARVTVNADVENSTGLMLPSSIAGGDLVVLVVDESGKGLDAVRVELNKGAAEGRTNLEGQAQFTSLPPGQYVVSARPMSKHISGTAEVKAGHTQTLTMVAKDAPSQVGTIKVTVTTPGGKDLDFTVVSISPAVHPPQMAGTGRVTFSNVPVGDYVVEASLNDMVARQNVRLRALGGPGGTASAHLVLSGGGSGGDPNQGNSNQGDSLEDLVIN